MKQLTSLSGIRRIESPAAPTAGGSAGSASYLITLDLSDGQDAIVASLLRRVLDMGITPRSFTQSRSLEKHFLEVTGAADSR